jgi:hypothetical protein
MLQGGVAQDFRQVGAYQINAGMTFENGLKTNNP